MAKINVVFEAGEGKHFEGGVNFMEAVNFDGIIYAECEVPEGASDDYGYITLKNAILDYSCAIKVAPEDLVFQYEGQEDHLAGDADVECPVYMDLCLDLCLD